MRKYYSSFGSILTKFTYLWAKYPVYLNEQVKYGASVLLSFKGQKSCCMHQVIGSRVRWKSLAPRSHQKS